MDVWQLTLIIKIVRLDAVATDIAVEFRRRYLVLINEILD